MKRDAALVGLSHDHHQALFVAQALRRATDADAAEVVAAFADFWRGGGERHFEVEERVLLPAFAEEGDPHHPLVLRMLGDHVDLRCRARRVLADRPDGGDAPAAGDGPEATGASVASGVSRATGASAGAQPHGPAEPHALDDVHALGERLAAHVRLEEREVFPLVEETLSADRLRRLGEELERAEGPAGR